MRWSQVYVRVDVPGRSSPARTLHTSIDTAILSPPSFENLHYPRSFVCMGSTVPVTFGGRVSQGPRSASGADG